MYKISLLLCAICVTFATWGQNNVAAPLADMNGVIDNTPDSIQKARTVRPVSGSSRIGDNPVLFLVGNSTMRTGTLGNGDNGQWGWGYYMPDFFDKSKITVENHALGGMSSRTFYNVLWKDVLEGVRPGDWVIIELGHNDHGPYDRERARSSIPGIGEEALPVVIQETGVKDTVRSYGEYMRRYVRETKARGGKPILMSLTPRMAWDDKDSTRVTRVDSTFGLWARQVAEAEGVPFINLNDITARKFERFGKDKVKTMFYLDRIHTSAFGAKVNAESAVEGIRSLKDVELKDYLLPETMDTITGTTRKDDNPVLFLVGDSTVKNEDKDKDGMWGWGSVIAEYFDTDKISVENHAMAGRSARTFLDEGRWDKVYNALRPGDFVIIQFGHNDGGAINTGKARGELGGTGAESKVYKMEKTAVNQVIYTYGWYLRKFIMDAREKGAIPIIASPTPRSIWNEQGKIESMAGSYAGWAREVANKMRVPFIDLNKLTGNKMQALGEEKAKPYYKNDHTHTSMAGAHINAETIIEALRGDNSGLEKYLKPAKYSFDISSLPIYNEFDGYGFDFGTKADKQGSPYYVSARVPDGNYRVTLTIGDRKRAGATTVRAEGRRLMLDDVKTRKGEEVKRSIVVNKRTPKIEFGDSVRLNDREINTATWDNKLTIEINGDKPAVSHIEIEPIAEGLTTVYLAGNSTVVDQVRDPWTSWGQIVPAYFDESVVIANHAESGESAGSFIAQGRLDKILTTAKPGDYLFIEFGHNDQKEKWAGAGAHYNFAHNLKTFIDRAKQKGMKPVLLTPVRRRAFDDNGNLKDTHGEYPAVIREIAAREGVPCIDLQDMTETLYKALGVEGSKSAFVHYRANTFAGQNTPLADNTHFNAYGATQIAKCVVEGIRQQLPDLSTHLLDIPIYNPAAPDKATDFVFPLAPIAADVNKPYGN